MGKTNRATGRRKPADVFVSPPVADDDRFGDIGGLIAEMNDEPDARAGAARVLEEIAGAQAEHALGLQMLRATFGLTQTELAGALGISQANVAQTEQRGDMLVSTLRRYVETITGGELRLVVTMPGRPPLEFNLIEVEGVDTNVDAPRKQPTAKVRGRRGHSDRTSAERTANATRAAQPTATATPRARRPRRAAAT